ncbi:hypothetical protein F9L33_14045 [Amylibacter sp. SFDW26]|uniref:trimeric intracellular cation channel family protein n=1 Tax=Amylibacter sp. SFDW26 TaxID=2652722 RepID=UPI0012624CA9|nr:TRIC cation channel family protein [Amylibacter sp. SFDW26]KAB7610418.1 hypothetical protein F9L33_14045 [Amylibacter sp. SFDW26]
MLSSLSSITFGLTIVATVVMAATAAIQAARQDFDPFGAVVLAIVTAVGGGTLRDLLIGATPVFWLVDMTYLSTAVPIGLVTYFIAKRYNNGGGQRLIFLQYLDGIGLALFTLVGTQAALANELPVVSAVVLGCITGVAGGMFRDILCGLQPAILKQDLYATISLIGGAIYILCRDHMAETSSLILAFIFMIIVRWMVVYRNGRAA